MTTKAKDDTDEDTDDEGGGDDGTDDEGGNGATDDRLVEDVASRVLELLGANDEPGGAGGGDSGGGDRGAGPAPRSAADVERATERAVRDAMDKLRREEANEGRLRTLERKVEEKVKEAAPAQVRRLTKFMWGAGDRR